MPTEILFVDYETRSRVSIKAVGADAYARDPSTDILFVAVAHARGPVTVETRLRGVVDDALARGNVLVLSWGDFDRSIFGCCEKHRSVPWLDLSLIARFLGLPRSLEGCAQAFGVRVTKDKRGNGLIRKYSIPRADGTFTALEPGSQDDDDFRAYCAQDTRLLRQLYTHLKHAIPVWAKTQLENTRLIDRMNARGVPIDLFSVHRAVRLLRETEHDLVHECVRISGYKPTQVNQLKDWLGLPDLQKGTLEQALRIPATGRTSAHRRVMQIRLEVAKASTKKLSRMAQVARLDGRAHGCFQANGAHTGRLSSSLIQFQNMVRAPADPIYFDALATSPASIKDPFLATSEASRGFVCAPAGRTLMSVDYSQIECRVLAWLAGEQALLSAFARGWDVYRLMAATVFDVVYPLITSGQRQFGKVVVLGCGFQLGGVGLLSQLEAYGIEGYDEGRAWEVVYVFRRTFPRIVNLWYALQRAVIDVVEGRTTAAILGPIKVRRVREHIQIVLPSGRPLWYLRMQVLPGERGPSLYYSGRDQAMGGTRLSLVSTYGGRMVENVVQAIAADLMLHGMRSIEVCGFAPVMSVHDEVVVEVDECEGTPESLSHLCAVACAAPAWATGIPLKAEGWINRRFTKQ